MDNTREHIRLIEIELRIYATTLWNYWLQNQRIPHGKHLISLTPMVPAHLSIPLITGQGTGTETCGIDSVFPPDDLWIGLDTYMNCILIYDLFL